MDVSSHFLFDPIARQILLNIGKVEIGQHVHNAFRVIAADALNIDKSRLGLSVVSTQSSPNDGLTAGSLSVQVTGASLKSEALALRSNLLQEAAQWFETDIENVVLDGDTLEFSTSNRRCSLFDLPITKTSIGESIGGKFDTSSTIPTSIQGTRSLRGRKRSSESGSISSRFFRSLEEFSWLSDENERKNRLEAAPPKGKCSQPSDFYRADS